MKTLWVSFSCSRLLPVFWTSSRNWTNETQKMPSNMWLKDILLNTNDILLIIPWICYWQNIFFFLFKSNHPAHSISWTWQYLSRGCTSQTTSCGFFLKHLWRIARITNSHNIVVQSLSGSADFLGISHRTAAHDKTLKCCYDHFSKSFTQQHLYRCAMKRQQQNQQKQKPGKVIS